MNIFQLALENKDSLDFLKTKEPNIGQAVREKEHVVFARLLNFAQLKKAKRAEKQTQYIIEAPKTEENVTGGSIRIREIIKGKNGEPKYLLTTKAKVQEGKIEVTIPTTKQNFIQFGTMCNVSMVKHRYFFPIEGTEFEWTVDCVPDGNGGYCPWVRCEIEVSDLSAKVPELPLETEELILPPEMSETTEEEFDAKTKPLLDRFFVKKNPYVKEESSKETELEVEDTPEEVSEAPVEGEDDTKVKTDANTTGEEKLSIDNITDDKDVAEKVETRSEQIEEKKEENNEEKTEETTEEDNQESNEESDESNDSSDDNTSGDNEKSDKEEKPEQSNESIGFAKLFSEIGLATESLATNMEHPEVVEVSPYTDEILTQSINELKEASELIKVGSDEDIRKALDTIYNVRYKYTQSTEEVTPLNYSHAVDETLLAIANRMNIDTSTLDREGLIESINNYGK